MAFYYIDALLWASNLPQDFFEHVARAGSSRQALRALNRPDVPAHCIDDLYENAVKVERMAAVDATKARLRVGVTPHAALEQLGNQLDSKRLTFVLYGLADDLPEDSPFLEVVASSSEVSIVATALASKHAKVVALALKTIDALVCSRPASVPLEEDLIKDLPAAWRRCREPFADVQSPDILLAAASGATRTEDSLIATKILLPYLKGELTTGVGAPLTNWRRGKIRALVKVPQVDWSPGEAQALLDARAAAPAPTASDKTLHGYIQAHADSTLVRAASQPGLPEDMLPLRTLAHFYDTPEARYVADYLLARVGDSTTRWAAVQAIEGSFEADASLRDVGSVLAAMTTP